MTRSIFLLVVLCSAYDSHAQYELAAKEQSGHIPHELSNGSYTGLIPHAVDHGSIGPWVDHLNSRYQRSTVQGRQIAPLRDTIQGPTKTVRNTIYAGVGGFGPPFSLNYELSWGSGKKAWGVAVGGYYRNVSEGSRAPMSSVHTWQMQVNRMAASRAGFEYGAGFIYSSGMEASEKDTGYPQRLFLGVKPACLRIQFKPRGVMIRLYGIGLITLHEFNAEWRKKIEELNDPRVFGSAWKFPLSALIGLEVGYTF